MRKGEQVSAHTKLKPKKKKKNERQQEKVMQEKIEVETDGVYVCRGR